MSPPPKLTSSCCIRDWCSLVYGQPSYMGQVYQPHPMHKTTSVRGEKKRTPWEKSGKAVTQWPTSKASLGWKNRKLWLLPWMSTGESTEDRWRLQVMWSGCRPQKEHVHNAEETTGWCPLTLADSKPQEECNQSWNWVMVGKAKQKWGGVKWVSNPHVRKNDNICLPLWHGMLLPTKRGTLAACRGVASYPPMKKPESATRAWGCALTKKTGGMLDKPPRIYQAIALDSLEISSL